MYHLNKLKRSKSFFLSGQTRGGGISPPEFSFMYMKRDPFGRMCLQEERGGDYREGAQLRIDIAKAQEPFGNVITTPGGEPDFPQASSISTHPEK